MRELSATIVNLSHDGRGITHYNGKTIFIPDTLPGETITFVITKKHSNYDEGRLLKIITPSPERIIPACEHYSVCGGCSWQHLKNATQIEYKQKILLDQLWQFAKVKPEKILPPLLGPEWGYRTRARLGIKFSKQNKVIIGFREKNSHDIADLKQCLTLYPTVSNKFSQLKDLIKQLTIARQIPQIEVAVTQNITALIFRHLKPFSEKDLYLLNEFAQQHLFKIYLQPGNDESIHPLKSEDTQLLSYQLADQQLTLWFDPADFTQINSAINQQMINQTLNLLAPQKTDKILDLFCGLGNFTLPLAKGAGHVTGIEGNRRMVERAKYNANYNRLTEKTSFYTSDLTANFLESIWAQQTYDKILLDPPRTGALQIVKSMQRFKAQQILYISCNTATLARDASELIKQGYQLQAAGVMDMFPQTEHVEAMALFGSRSS